MVAFELNTLQVECTMFFQENPYTFETVNGISIRIGRRVEDLLPVLGALVESMILERVGSGESAIYRYIQPTWSGLNEESLWNEV
ncbi:hypothetical protein FZC84_12595 [Rossellomorea vietnamensis]|uniref:Uncharacterized protein n=1 Tax=Rossellomorea vietnamensis TaxID=218284 RepID=A0A5D4MBJ4_9BACI|nr:hypothetical protein [Rossellomorea vietnamensis]TYR98858.1 hypothetical protein FZC84_12595 [Rossellomorea vietnamensis]